MKPWAAGDGSDNQIVETSADSPRSVQNSRLLCWVQQPVDCLSKCTCIDSASLRLSLRTRVVEARSNNQLIAGQAPGQPSCICGSCRGRQERQSRFAILWSHKSAKYVACINHIITVTCARGPNLSCMIALSGFSSHSSQSNN